ncbi:MAG: hypothetical protein WAO02_15785 [Verrucomicrobiia bacterium]
MIAVTIQSELWNPVVARLEQIHRQEIVFSGVNHIPPPIPPPKTGLFRAICIAKSPETIEKLNHVNGR